MSQFGLIELRNSSVDPCNPSSVFQCQPPRPFVGRPLWLGSSLPFTPSLWLRFSQSVRGCKKKTQCTVNQMEYFFAAFDGLCVIFTKIPPPVPLSLKPFPWVELKLSQSFRFVYATNKFSRLLNVTVITSVRFAETWLVEIKKPFFGEIKGETSSRWQEPVQLPQRDSSTLLACCV